VKHEPTHQATLAHVLAVAEQVKQHRIELMQRVEQGYAEQAARQAAAQQAAHQGGS
jgi:hypothetical protein